MKLIKDYLFQRLSPESPYENEHGLYDSGWLASYAGVPGFQQVLTVLDEYEDLQAFVQDVEEHAEQCQRGSDSCFTVADIPVGDYFKLTPDHEDCEQVFEKLADNSSFLCRMMGAPQCDYRGEDGVRYAGPADWGAIPC